MKYLYIIIQVSMWALSVSTQAQNIIVSRTSGVAPLSLHMKVDLTDWEQISTSDYEWFLPDGNKLYGFQNTAIVHESGWIKLKTTDATGVEYWDSVLVNVDNPNALYAGALTYCMSSSGDFEGCPVGAEQMTITDLTAWMFNPHHRYLLRSGDTFEMAASRGVGEHVYRASYGTTGTYPVIMMSWDAMSTAFWLNDNIVIKDIFFLGHEWVSSPAWGDAMYGEGRFFSPGHFNTF